MPRKTRSSTAPLVGIAMGSQSDWEIMQHTANLLQSFEVPCSTDIVSAHRTPQRLYDYASNARAKGYQVLIAGAGGAAHLPGMIAAMTVLPVFGVPVPSKALDGLDSLLSIAQMPGGIPVGTLAIGKAGAINAGLLAVAVLALQDDKLAKKLQRWRVAQTASIGKKPQSEKSKTKRKAR